MNYAFFVHHFEWPMSSTKRGTHGWLLLVMLCMKLGGSWINIVTGGFLHWAAFELCNQRNGINDIGDLILILMVIKDIITLPRKVKSIAQNIWEFMSCTLCSSNIQTHFTCLVQPKRLFLSHIYFGTSM